MIDPGRGWTEIRTVLSTQVDLVFNQVELSRLIHYPLPGMEIMDRGNEFLAEFREITA